MKQEVDRWEPYPTKPEPSPVNWDSDYLNRKRLFKEHIKLERVPEAARGLGEELRKAREACGITLDELAAQTRIRKYHLEAIERGDLEKLPGGIYTRSYVKQYAKFVKFDESEVRKAFMPSGGAGVQLLNNFLPEVASRVRDARFEREENHSKLPKLGEYLLYLILSKSERVTVIGDLTEDYEEIKAKFNKAAADIYFYKQILLSLSPFVGKSIMRLLVKIFEELMRGPKL